MSEPEHRAGLRAALRNYVTERATEQADAILNAALDAIHAFDFEGELLRMVKRELERWVRESVTDTFRGVLKDPELHDVARVALRNLITEMGEPS